MKPVRTITTERITYMGVMRTPDEWLTVMGYDLGTIRMYLNNRSHRGGGKISRKTRIVEELLDYVYQGVDCNIPFKDDRHPKNLANMVFGSLTAVKPVGDNQHWLCKCRCGNSKVIPKRNLLDGFTRSCGCLQKSIRTSYLTQQKAKGYADCKRLEYNGRTLTVTEWSRQPEQIELGIKRRNIYNRLRRGWSVEDTLTTPCQHPIVIDDNF